MYYCCSKAANSILITLARPAYYVHAVLYSIYVERHNTLDLGITVYPSYTDSGYNDIFLIAIRSHGIDYACTLSKPLWMKR